MARNKAGRDSFTDFVLDQMEDLGGVEARSMFGGKGLYWKDAIFGLIDEGRLYFRVGPATLSRYETEGCKPFEPWPGHVMKGYYEVPSHVLEAPEEIVVWAREAWALPRAKASKQKGARGRPAKPGTRGRG